MEEKSAIMNKILVIDDDVELCALLADYLGQEGFEVDSSHEARQALEVLGKKRYDLLVLDVMLPDMSGFELLRLIRTDSAVPVLMLSARGEEIDRIIGLEMGADDYLPKPFNPRELLARIRAIQRRSEMAVEKKQCLESERLIIGDLSLDLGSRSAARNGEAVELTAVEFSLLHELVKNAGQIVRREELCERVLERKLAAFDRSIDVHVSSLRKKLGHGAANAERIKTIRGVGYFYVQTRGGSADVRQQEENEHYSAPPHIP